jgi:hypothetical protein
VSRAGARFRGAPLRRRAARAYPARRNSPGHVLARQRRSELGCGAPSLARDPVDVPFSNVTFLDVEADRTGRVLAIGMLRAEQSVRACCTGGRGAWTSRRPRHWLTGRASTNS